MGWEVSLLHPSQAKPGIFLLLGWNGHSWALPEPGLGSWEPLRGAVKARGSVTPLPVPDGRDPCTSLPKSWPCSCALGLAGKEPSRGNLCPAELSPNQTQPLQDTSSAPSTALAPCPGWKEMFGFDLLWKLGPGQPKSARLPHLQGRTE